MKPTRAIHAALYVSVLLSLTGIVQAEQRIPLSSLDLSLMTTGWSKAKANQSIMGKPIKIGDREYAIGVGTHAESELDIDLDGRGEKFEALVGVDMAAASALSQVEFMVVGDDKELWRSGLCKLGDAAKPCNVPLAGVRILKLIVTDGNNGITYDHANWAEAYITFAGAPPKAIPVKVEDDTAPPEEAVILTPPAPPLPRINGPKAYGVRPGSPFLYRIPATGKRPMTFTAEGLPAGLQLDPNTGIITGRLADKGKHAVKLIARNQHGESRRDFRIVAGDKLALTPPMGWNSWYIHYDRVSDTAIRAAADAMIASGMADYGYQYVNIDDCWAMATEQKALDRAKGREKEITGEPRGPDGRIQPNQRFPNMKAMTDYIHAKGLKAGIYTSPGPRTCAGYEAAHGHEALDAKTFADWGFDFLKYDWCSYREIAEGTSREHMVKPYKLMWDQLQKLDRDIIFNLCQYGMGDAWEWAGQVGHCWRTTGDLGIEGGKLSKGIYKVGLFNATLADYAGPGRWNDPDFIVVGWVGDARGMGQGRPTSLTPNEQYSHMSMWCLMAAPLFFSGDMTKLDPFTLNILCNHEVIAVDQDALGKQARIAKKTAEVLILVKDMEDGGKAVGLFNMSKTAMEITVDWTTLGVKGPQQIRDLWRQKDLGTFDNTFKTTIPRHGVTLLLLSKMQ